MIVEKGIDFEKFNSDLDIQYSDYASEKLKKDYWVVKNSFVYYLNKDKTRYVFVESGYLTDGASVPRIFWNILPPWGKYGQACVLHDWLCEYHRYMTSEGLMRMNSKQVNVIFNDAMKTLKVPNLTRTIMYKAVELNRVVDGFNSYTDEKRAVEMHLRAYNKETGKWK